MLDLHPREAQPNAQTAESSGSPKRVSQNQIAEILINADRLLKNGEIDLARNLVSKALLIDSHNPEALKRLIPLLAKPNERAQVLNCLKEVQMTFEVCYQLGNLFRQAGDDESSKAHYQDALMCMTFDQNRLFEIYKNLGNISLRQKDLEAAEEYYFKAATLTAGTEVIDVNLGTLEVQREQWNEALEKFRLAISKNPQSDNAWVGLAICHNALGDSELAFGNLAKALELNPKHKAALLMYVQNAMSMRKYDSAIDYMCAYNSEVDFDEQISFVLSHFFCLVGRKDLARIELEKILLWNPGHAQALAAIEQM